MSPIDEQMGVGKMHIMEHSIALKPTPKICKTKELLSLSGDLLHLQLIKRERALAFWITPEKKRTCFHCLCAILGLLSNLSQNRLIFQPQGMSLLLWSFMLSTQRYSLKIRMSNGCHSSYYPLRKLSIFWKCMQSAQINPRVYTIGYFCL